LKLMKTLIDISKIGHFYFFMLRKEFNIIKYLSIT